MQLIFYKDNSIASKAMSEIVQRVATRMRLDVLTIENEKAMPTPSVLVKDDQGIEVFRTGNIEALTKLITPSVKAKVLTAAKKYTIHGAIGLFVLIGGIVVYQKRRKRNICACD